MKYFELCYIELLLMGIMMFLKHPIPYEELVKSVYTEYQLTGILDMNELIVWMYIAIMQGMS